MARILVISPYEPPPDGIGKHTAQLVGAWDAAGHSVLVVSPKVDSSSPRSETIGSLSRVVRVLGIAPRRRTREEIQRFQPDFVFVQFAISAVSVNFWSVWSACKGFARAHVPIVVAFHEPVREYDLLGVVTRGLYRSMARVTNVPIAFSFAGAQALRESGLFKQVVELPHGTTGPSEVGGSDVARVRERYGVKKPLVLVLGYTSPDKGTDVLLDAVPAIVKAQGNVAQFIIAGAPRKRRGIFRVLGKRDVAHLRHLRDQASRLSNVDVTFYGFVADEDVNALLYTADVVALPYRRITQSGIANLAISSRSVIVSSDLPGLRSDLGDAAKYVRVADAEDLASAILELLDPSAASLRERMRELSAERAIENTFAKVAEKIVSAASEYGAAQRL